MKIDVFRIPSIRLNRIQLSRIVCDCVSSRDVIQSGRNLNRKIESAIAMTRDSANKIASAIFFVVEGAAVDEAFDAALVFFAGFFALPDFAASFTSSAASKSSANSFAEKLIALVPITIISNKFIIPRMNGMFSARIL